MVLGNDLQETGEGFAETLSPEQITKAHHKSLELDKSLGFSDNFENSDPSEDDQPSLFPTKSETFPSDELLNVKQKDVDIQIEVLSPESRTKEDVSQDQFLENEKFIASIAAEVEYEKSLESTQEHDNPPSPEVQIFLPSEVARDLRQGGFKLILEP